VQLQWLRAPRPSLSPRPAPFSTTWRFRISKHHLKSWLLVAKDPSAVLVYSGPSTFCSYWSPDHFIRGFGIGPFLFSVGLESQSALGRAVVSEELLRELVIDRLLLSEKKIEVTITTEVEGSAWHIKLGGCKLPRHQAR